MKPKLTLFLTAMSQVTLVSMNVVFISKAMVVPMLVTGWGISFIWTLNVRRAAFSGIRDKLIYATGAMFGTGIGFYIAKYLTTIL